MTLVTTSSSDLIRIAQKFKIRLDDILCKDEIPPNLKTGCYIINLDDAVNGQGGTHWTALIVQSGNDMYFDSFGVVSPQQIEKLHGKYLYSNIDVQDINATSCGYWCLYWLKYMQKNQHIDSKIAYGNFLSQFKKNKDFNEKFLEKIF